MLTLNDGRAELWQWDTGRTLTVDADCSQVHFSNKIFGRSIDVDVVDGVAIIPDILLQTDKDLFAWAFVGTPENGYTKISKVFKVNRRNKPSDYVFTPPEQTTLGEILERFDVLESVKVPDAIKNAVEDYLEQNPVEVESVNGKTGAVQLSASDVGARPDNWMPTADQIGADPTGTALTVVAKHNTAEDSHNDIRLELQAINNRLTAFFDSDEQTLDELSEIVAYITSNKTLIDSITTSKVSVADIINNLTTNVSNKPLSAAQGVILKGMIDTISNNLSNYQPKGDYLTEAQLEPVRKSAEEANAKVDTLREVVSKFHSNIIEEANGETIVLNDASDMELAGLRIFGKTTQDGTPTPEAPVELVSVGDGGNIGVTVCGKNLIPKGYTSKTTNGLTFTVNDDGSVTVNGTAESNTGFNIIREYEIPGDVIISGCPAGGSVKTYSIYAQNYDFTGNALSDTGEGKLIKKSDFDKPIILRIWILAGQTVSNLVFKPMIRSASIEDDTFEPYTAQQLTIATPNGLPGLEVTDPALATYTDDKGRMWCADEVDFERGMYIQRIGRLALKDVPDWSRYVYFNGTVSYYNHTVLTDTIDTHTTINGLCTHVYNKSVTEISNNFIIHSDKNEGIELKNITDNWGLTDDTSTIKSQIYALGVELIYILAKPIETTLTAEELAAYAALHTNYPNTTVFNDCGAGMEVKYVADTKLYIDKKFAELSAALLNQ